MPDVSVTAAEVLPGTDTQYLDGIAGASITAGQAVYLDSVTNTFKLADTDASATTSVVRGIAMHAAATGQPIRVASGGHLDPGFTVTVGMIYVLSGTAGGIAPASDLASGDFTSIIGVGITASSLRLILNNSGVQVPA